MSRWIDADAIEDKAKQYSLGYYEEDEWAVPFKEINSAPSIDIVRCKECKYRDYWGSCTFLQNKGDAHKPIMTDADDFCSYGERKESE